MKQLNLQATMTEPMPWSPWDAREAHGLKWKIMSAATKTQHSQAEISKY